AGAPDRPLRHPRSRRGADAGEPHHPAVGAPGPGEGGRRGDLPPAARRRGPPGDRGVRPLLLARLARARRGVPALPRGRAGRGFPVKRSGASVLAWQVAILAAGLSIWEWGWDVARVVLPKPWLPKILDPYFISKPSAIWR